MENIIKIGSRQMRRDQVAFIAPAAPDPTRREQFHSWVTLANGTTFGTTETPEQIATQHRFTYIADDQVAINREAYVRIRSFTPAEDSSNPTTPSGQPIRTEISVGKDRDRRWQNLSTDPGAVARAVFPGADIVSINRDYVPVDHVAFYDAYAPRPDDRVQNAQGAARLVTGRTILGLMTPQEFAFDHGFNHLGTDWGDDTAFNPRFAFILEALNPDEIKDQIGSTKEWQTRLSWEGPTRQLSGSKLLLTPDDEAAPVVFAGEPQGARRGPKPLNGPKAASDFTPGD